MVVLMPYDICVKEALAALYALESVADSLWNRRIDLYTDNAGLLFAWTGLKASSSELVLVLRSLFTMCCEYNIFLKMHWISTKLNSADDPSRALRRSDCALSVFLRRRVWSAFGPFSFDLMALPSNVFCDPTGVPLPFFSP